MIKYYLALVLQKQGKKEESLLVLKDLADRFPDKSLYQLSVFDVLYKSGQHEAAFPCLLQSVKSSPNLLNGQYVKNLFLKDSPMKKLLQDELLRDISKTSVDDPVILARHGSLLLSLGFEQEAKKCLEKAILLLPNLIYPYYYLSQIENNQNNHQQAMLYLKQFVFLYSGSISKNAIDQTINSGKVKKITDSRNPFTDQSYTAKFQTWYHSSIIINQLIP
jgi:tetratricopeptide (TPR) repeat protein